MEYVIITFIVIIIFAAIVLILQNSGRFGSEIERSGKEGEKYAVEIIRSIMRADDVLLTNVTVSYGTREAELDNVIVNENGIFIIEVKNYNGRLEGGENDFLWSKFHTSRGGRVYEKTVKNPIKQVKRQIFITAKYLKINEAPKIWVDGYAILLSTESPVKSRFILTSTDEIDEAIHTKAEKTLDSDEISAAVNILTSACSNVQSK